MPPTSKPIATERKSFTSMIQASLMRKLDEAYHERNRTYIPGYARFLVD